MLFIKNYTKGELDKSGLSMVEYYTRMIEDINVGIEEIRQYLVDMLDTVESLRKELYAIKDQVQEDLDKTKDAYEEAGYTNEGLDRAQEILDGVEEEVEEIEEGIEEEIEKIDCSQPDPECSYDPGCFYDSGCFYDGKGCNYTSCDQPDDPVTCDYIEEPTCKYTDPDKEDCTYCEYRTSDDEGVWGAGGCDVCGYGDCKVNIDCNQPTSCSVQDCEYSLCLHELDTGAWCSVSTSGGVTECKYTGGIPENCTFTCAHSSPCGNQSISDCIYTCSDAYCSQGCNHEMCSQCDYSSGYCGQEESSCDEFPCTLPSDCDYNAGGDCNYDANTGIDYDCFQTDEEKCGDCSDCSNDCGDSCSNDCSHYDCGESDTCFYSEECDETWGGCTHDCNEDCGDCGDCNYYSCDESDECFYSEDCDESW